MDKIFPMRKRIRRERTEQMLLTNLQRSGGDGHVGRVERERILPQVTLIGAAISIGENMEEPGRTNKLAGRGA